MSIIARSRVYTMRQHVDLWTDQVICVSDSAGTHAQSERHGRNSTSARPIDAVGGACRYYLNCLRPEVYAQAPPRDCHVNFFLFFFLSQVFFRIEFCLCRKSEFRARTRYEGAGFAIISFSTMKI